MRRSVVISCTLVCLCFCLPFSAFAQSSQHDAAFSWSPSNTPNITGYHLWQAPCNGTIDSATHECSVEGVFAIVATLPASSNGHSLTGLTAGQKLVWKLTAFVETSTTTGESPDSNHFAALIPKDTVLVGAPGSFTTTIH